MKLAFIRFLNRNYRRIKTWLLIHNPPLVTNLFFGLLSMLDQLLTSRRLNKYERLANVLWKQGYFAYWNEHSTKRFRLQTDHPVAYSSDDHKYPRGAIHDNSKNYRFNLKLYEMLGFRQDLAVLDLGCAGGGFVKSILEDGHMAIGLEGSDASKKVRSGEWDTIPYHLFTCDITKAFRLFSGDGKEACFDVITAWEVFEHISEPHLEILFQNIQSHLKPGGFLICSIDLLPDGNPKTGAVYHKTLQSKEWWESYFSVRGLVKVGCHPFKTFDMLRGNGSSFKDWHPEDGSGIHLILQKAGTQKRV